VRGELLFINDQNRKWFILAAASCAFGLVRIDETVAAVALSTIQHDLSMSRVLTHWVINSYLTVLAGFVAVGGELSDITGYRKLFITLSVGCF
jgi:MFS family permease